MLPFHDLAAQYRAHKDEIDAAVARVLGSGEYVLGAEGRAFEAEFAAHAGAPHAIGVGAGAGPGQNTPGAPRRRAGAPRVV
jgi:dTDP-4-amino-4,6-dideoxygalactose transaminase